MTFGVFGSRPHIVFHLMDDWGYNSWPGEGDVPREMLPHIASTFVDSGLRLTRHYATRMCAPSRRSLMTGRFMPAIGNHNDDCEHHDSQHMSLLPQRLQAMCAH